MLQAESLTYELRGKALIQDINLQFSPGILYGILGPNGSGKSTLLKTLTGIWPSTQGRVLWHGQNLFAQERRQISRTISMVPQNVQMYFDFSVIEAVSMGCYCHGIISKAKEQQMLEEALHSVDIWHLRDRAVAHLSTGERQRVYIARALVTESPILLLDEPTASLDIRHQLDIWQLLRRLLNKNKVIIVTSHDLASTERYCDSIAVLQHGRCVAQGLFSEVMDDRVLCDVFGVKTLENVQKSTLSSFE